MKKPPIAKVYEALTAIVSNRVEMMDDKAIVHSSTLEKSYQVCWDKNKYSSTDNASVWQGYPGYPIIAVLFLQGRLPYQQELAVYLKDIPWNDINKKYKRDYDKAIQEVLLPIDKTVRKELEEYVSTTYQQLLSLDLEIVRNIKK